MHVWVRRWLAEEWPEWAPRTRASAIEALARFVPLIVVLEAPLPPPNLRRYLSATLPPSCVPVPDDPAEKWLERWCLKIGQLNRQVLAMAERRLLTAGDGGALAASTASRYRKVAHACIRRAVDLEILAADPWPPRPRGRSHRKATRTKQFDVRRLPEPRAMAEAIEAIASHQPGSLKYRLMTAVVYYAGLRPSEVVMLRPRALQLPKRAGAGST